MGASRQDFVNAAKTGNWQLAFDNLNGLNMTDMLAALDEVGDETVAKLKERRAAFPGRYDMPRLDYAMAVVQDRALPATAPSDLAATGQVQDAINHLKATETTWAEKRVRAFYDAGKISFLPGGAEALFLKALKHDTFLGKTGFDTKFDVFFSVPASRVAAAYEPDGSWGVNVMLEPAKTAIQLAAKGKSMNYVYPDGADHMHLKAF